ncbi:MAG: nitroreductase family protein [Spirochaetales bacterium]|nr:nitroreductase family protein [Spirochaetales bacterium]
MKITGIDEKKCSACGVCVQECAAGIYSVNGSKHVTHDDPYNWCTGCGHCVAVCPKDAIIYTAHEKTLEYPDKDISIKDVEKLLHTKRSIRRYKNKDVPEKEIEKLLEIMRFAPSGHNAQPCEYVVVKDREKIRMLGQATIASFKSFKKLIKIRKLLKPFIPKAFYEILSDRGTALGVDELIRQYESGKDIIFFDAPVLILAHVPNLGGLSYVDPTIALTYGMLAAHALGLGSCWMGFAMMAVAKHKKILQLLNIPKGRFIAGVITFGYPVHTYYRVPVRNKIKAEWYV